MTLHETMEKLLNEHSLQDILNALADTLLEEADRVMGGPKLKAAARRVGEAADSPEVQAI